MNLYMICGVGSSGKSTLANFLSKTLPSNKLLKVDSYMKIYNNLLISYYYWIQDIKKTIVKNDKDNLIIDFSLDSTESRKRVLDEIDNFENINLICIFLNPDANVILKHYSQRDPNFIQTNDKKIKIQKLVNNVQLPTENEFKSYNFKSIKIIVLNEEINFDIL